ncbi:MAG: hypothetical protein QG635_2298 [Bacteroidota bacterium]|nr:hypothetical protein [Bacteroidota bacterium]
MIYYLRNIELFIFILVFSAYSHSRSIEANSVNLNTDDTLQSSELTSDFHKQNAGKIIFSKTPIELGKENESGLSDTFSSNDYIWGIIYLNDSFKNLTQSNVNEVIQYIVVDGKETARYTFRMLPEKIEQTYLKTEIIVPPTQAKTKGVKTYVRGLSGISPEKHNVTVLMRIHNDTVARGEFTLDCSGGVETIKMINEDFETKAMKSLMLPNPLMRDVILETDILNSITDIPGKALKVVITDKGWTLIKNLSGEPAFRTINTVIAFRKPEANYCSMVFISFRQDYDGKEYGKTQKYAVGNSYDIPCENVK